MGTDEYNDVYMNEPLGFVFPCGSSLGQPRSITAKDMMDIPVTGDNEDLMYIYCKRCNEYMNYRYGGDEPLSGKWVCPKCGRTVREETVYRKLDAINRRFESDLLDDYDDIY